MKLARHALFVALAAGSGTLLFLSDFPTHAWALQVVALIPWLWVLSKASEQAAGNGPRSRPRVLEAAASGLVLGVFYTGPLLVVTGFPWLLAVGLGGYITALWIALSIAAVYALRWPGPMGAFGVGVAAVVAEWVTSHAVPIWGTAQSFVRVWSAAPWAIQFIEITGTAGIVFALVTVQALIVRLALDTRHRRAHAIALAAILTIVTVYDTIRWFEEPAATVRVAAAGWTHDQLPPASNNFPHVFVQRTLLPMFREGVERGARLLVSPEAGFTVRSHSREAAFSQLHEFARTHHVALAVGYFDGDRNDNRIAFIDASGVLRAEYRKTHLIPTMERYRAGDGTRAGFSVDGHRVGGMICQDDNFTDIASGYGRDAVPIVVVPTNDWHAVKDYHFENARMRAMENRYAVVRAASHGVSAIVSARGEVLAERDHFALGAGVVVADVPLLRGGSVHAWMRHGFALLCAALLGLFAWLGRRSRSS